MVVGGLESVRQNMLSSEPRCGFVLNQTFRKQVSDRLAVVSMTSDSARHHNQGRIRAAVRLAATAMNKG